MVKIVVDTKKVEKVENIFENISKNKTYRNKATFKNDKIDGFIFEKN